MNATDGLPYYIDGYNKGIEDCTQMVKAYFKNLLDENPQWELESVEDYALIPNKEISLLLEQLKEQKNG